ncbi:LysR family transcriptional regulator [Mesorhizobium abyssinicae]|uniref:LysR family transcriptional regulator n=1 Tax=Mesorhizobium abyssinicae TaxID=1209958 RepID=UPI003394C2B3
MRIAIEVARLGSFTAASRGLRLSAPSVSRIMAELEADLGVRLFNRTTRQLNLTEACLEFVQKSSGILEELDNMRSVVPRAPRHPARATACVVRYGFWQRMPSASAA